MARMNVNPTRMDLKRLKARLKTAVRGHKLLKDKTDEMVRRFSSMIRENKRLRDEVENDVSGVLSQFSVARSLMSRSDIELAFSMPSVSVELECSTNNIMSVAVPKLELSENRSANKFPYSFVDITSEADKSVELVGKVLFKLVKLAEIEKSTAMLADEIEKCKRRTKALENVLIPGYEEQIQRIELKLSGNELENTARLKTIKKKKM